MHAACGLPGSILWLICALAFPLQVTAEVFTVMSTSDAGAGSLRDAIAQANAQSGADEIVFDPALCGQTITLTSGQLTITDLLEVSGPGADQLTVARDASAPDFRIFEVDDGDDGTDVDVVISGLTITGGSVFSDDPAVPAQGGGVRTQERLVLRDATVSGNQAVSCPTGSVTAVAEGGGVYSSSYLLLAHTTISYNLADAGEDNPACARNALSSGGGVSADGYLAVESSSIVANRADAEAPDWFGTAVVHGGGIHGGAATVRNSTISGNTASARCWDGVWAYGGGIDAAGLVIDSTTVSANEILTDSDIIGGSRGGGINAESLEMSSCTVSGNSAGGWVHAYCAGVASSGSATIRNSTITDNDAGFGGCGGAYLQDGGRLESTIVSGNTIGAVYPSDVYCPESDCPGYAVVVCNLIGDPTDSSVPIGSYGNITGDPQLGPLQDNGGPTLTHALAFDSIAVDAGCNLANLGTDQRGYWPREFGGVADIGAYEYGAQPGYLFADDFEPGDTSAWSFTLP